MEIRKFLDKVHHELVKAYELPDYAQTDIMREFIFDYERAFQHKGTPDGTEHLRKAIKASSKVLEEMIAEKKRRDDIAKVIEKRKEKGLQ
jgi:cytochrome P450